ncbi:hypothetical protein [Nostoc sp.]|uniref:hypothetical protein n=1 Tax=Nostoc sp. TaxID=1180 RepID=UPI002FFB15FA
MTESDNRAAPRQLTLFAVESVATAPPCSPAPSWKKTYRSWCGQFQIVGHRQQRKKTEYDIAIEIYDPQGQWQQLVEITTQSLDVALQEFHDTVDHTFNHSGVIPLAPENKTALGHSFEDVWEAADCDRWNPAHFGDVPFQTDGNQVTIFWDSDEPPDPDDYLNREDYEQAWGEWEILVGGQVSKATFGDTAESLVGEQVTSTTKKTAPQHDTHWVERYWVERSGNKYWYFRYCWMTGRKIHRCYLGSVRSQLAKQKKADVEVWIADGHSPTEIEKLIRQQRSQHPTPNTQHPMPNDK